jgi:two-component system chemotaxis sensor kinase CheA
LNTLEFGEIEAPDASAGGEQKDAAAAIEASAAADNAEQAGGNGAKPAADASKKEARPSRTKRTDKQQSFINVNVNKIDKLMNLVGEIVTTESMFTKNPDIADMHLENFEKQARQLRKLTDELQDIVMSIRMVPIAATFHKMRRIVARHKQKDTEGSGPCYHRRGYEVDKT